MLAWLPAVLQDVGVGATRFFEGVSQGRYAVEGTVNLAVRGTMSLAAGNLEGWITSSGNYSREYWLMQPQFGGTISGPYRDWKVNSLNGGGLWGQYFRNLRNITVAKQIIDTASGSITTAENQQYADIAQSKAGEGRGT